jgi:hypothetical protein
MNLTHAHRRRLTASRNCTHAHRLRMRFIARVDLVGADRRGLGLVGRVRLTVLLLIATGRAVGNRAVMAREWADHLCMSGEIGRSRWRRCLPVRRNGRPGGRGGSSVELAQALGVAAVLAPSAVPLAHPAELLGGGRTASRRGSVTHSGQLRPGEEL